MIKVFTLLFFFVAVISGALASITVLNYTVDGIRIKYWVMDDESAAMGEWKFVMLLDCEPYDLDASYPFSILYGKHGERDCSDVADNSVIEIAERDEMFFIEICPKKG